VAACAVWGSTFVLVKDAVAEIPTLEFLALRFLLGAVLLAAVRPASVRALRRTPPTAVLCVGAALAAGYALQTFGLETAAATNAGFITGLFVVFTPIGAALVYRRLPEAPALVGVVLAAAGLVLLSLRLVGGRPSFVVGDALVLGCAVVFAVHILLLGAWAPQTDVGALTLGQVALAAVVFSVLSPLGGWRVPTAPVVWIALGVTAAGATAFGFTMQTWAQSRLSPTRTAVILTMEPVFAGVFGVALAGDRLTARNWVGAALIVAGMLAVEIRPGVPARSLESASVGDESTPGANHGQGDLRDR
jgi:drug/metabolite transporter (DMT)-like permease